MNCSKCNKVFEQSQTEWVTRMAHFYGRDDQKPLCRWCALHEFSCGRMRKAADFYAAMLVSGEMTTEDEQRITEALLEHESDLVPNDFDWDSYDESLR